MYNTENIWLISDEHFNHQNIIKYENRPFTDLYHMKNSIIYNHNQVVHKRDLVIHLGDFLFHLKDKEEIREILTSENGIHWLIKGNHDSCSTKFLLDAGFECVFEHPICIHNWYWLSHHPMVQISAPYFNIHGHLHSNPHHSEYEGNVMTIERMFNASIEMLGYLPIKMSDVINQLKLRN